MALRRTFTVAALAVSVAQAWLPGPGLNKRSIVDLDGYSLFNDTNVTPSAASVTGSRVDRRWLSSSSKVRGVNLGSLFIIEPWMMWSDWAGMGCADGPDAEFDCMAKLGQDVGDAKFQHHWDTYITAGDFDEMIASGLNTVRIPLGYWIMEELVNRDSEHFPKGALKFLKRVCGWASDRGMYVILELHGAPGSQAVDQSFTGQKTPNPAFYQNSQYDRAIKFVAWLRRLIHDTHEMRNVGMIGLVNENIRGNTPESLRTYYYPKAQQAIRDVESQLGISVNDFVHIQLMNSAWGPANPGQFMSSNYMLAYDDHRYIKWALPDMPQSDYLRTSCNDNRGFDWPTIVGEWSLSVPDDKQNVGEWRKENTDFYKKWFAAQVTAYEKYTIGWVFWSWKAEGDYRWSYKDAVNAGVIPRNLNSIATSGVCDGL